MSQRIGKPARKPTAKPRGTRKSKAQVSQGEAAFIADSPDTRVYLGDCRTVLSDVREVREGKVDLVFADPPFNWNRDYERARAVETLSAKGGGEFETWPDDLPRENYLDFTRQWIRVCAGALRPGGSMWINIPDDTAAEIVMFVKNDLKFFMANWCIWHYRFGQNRTGAFINSKVHALHFVKPGGMATWRPERVLEMSDRATIYFDPRTLSKKDGMPAGKRVPMDVWYGANWGRIQGNNKERRHGHDNQLPEAYLERVILATSNEGDLVLDPFVGSGTTATVARAYGRRFIGSEFSRANAVSAWERIRDIGMINKGKALGGSSAIFKARGVGKNNAVVRSLRGEAEAASADDTDGKA